ncbi:DUF4328 domain-containing protein [Flavivirga spongiicola]|uniref:DUF4328 domain-containing protein n=1 Tax=Flavivirga spongiicola TaxID=421621 RepID=A0ABU7XQ10_9FLAO|nr:DUF4328 domain-containing protein [Flavivirga sp. MEBiC05379]MDO5977611.1 DUF4328 domain-containing protein [Flavivirga sp. MEBiC05379]
MTLINDNSLRSKYTIIIFGIIAFIDITSIVLNLYQSEILKGYEINKYSDEDLELIDYAVMILGIIQFLTFITAIVLFIKWFRKAYGNLIRLGVNMDYTENSAVWGYFIPFVNWVKPVKTMKEIYLKTQQLIKDYNTNITVDQNTGFIVLWWVIYLINGFVANFATKQMNRADTIDAFIDANNAYIFSELIDLFAVGLAIHLVQKISKLELTLMETDTSMSLIDQIGNTSKT